MEGLFILLGLLLLSGGRSNTSASLQAGSAGSGDVNTPPGGQNPPSGQQGSPGGSRLVDSGGGVPASGGGVPASGGGVPASGSGVPESGSGVPASGVPVSDERASPVPGTVRQLNAPTAYIVSEQVAPIDQYHLQFPEFSGNNQTPAHAALYSRDGEFLDQGFVTLYEKTGLGYVPSAFLMDELGNLVG